MRNGLRLTLLTAGSLAIAFLMQTPAAIAELITFDGAGYTAGAMPPAPWTDVGTGRGGDPSEGVTYLVASGAGIGGSQALSVDSNYSYFEAAAVYILPTALTPGTPWRISVMIDPSQNDGFDLISTTFGGIYVGHGGWMIEDNASYNGVIFKKEGGNLAQHFKITGPLGLMGNFVASSAPNWYKVIFDIPATLDRMKITVVYPNGTTVTQGSLQDTTLNWNGQPINKIWLWGSNQYNGQPMYFDNLLISAMSLKNDFNADGITDLPIFNTTSGETALWFMNDDGTAVSDRTLFTNANVAIVGTGDFNKDGICDLIKRDATTGQTVLWFMNADGTRSGYKILFTDVNATITGTGDFNGDGICDLIKYSTTTRQSVLWFMNATGTRAGYKVLFTDSRARVVATGDFNGDGICDLIKRSYVNEQTVLWFMNADGSRAGYKILFTAPNENVVGTGDFNNDGICDLLKRNSTTGQTVLWFMNADGTRANYKVLFTDTNARVKGTGDYDADGICDLIKRNTATGQTVIWFMNADGTRKSYEVLFTNLSLNVVPDPEAVFGDPD